MHQRKLIPVITALALTSLVVIGCSDDDDDTASTDTTAVVTTTSDAPLTTASPDTTATTPDGEQPETAVWPFASSDTRFTDPVVAATGFATTYLGFTEPVVGEFQQGDSRSGEVEVRARATGPVTTVFVRQLTDDDSWWILGAATANLQLTSPEVLTAISSPVTLTGESTAFEANVNVEIRQDESLEPLGEDFVMGGANGEMGPFSKAIAFDEPTAPGGAIILRTYSMEDGSVWEAGVVRVAFSS